MTDETGMEDSTISKPVRKSRGWLKFSLRGLLLFIAIFGIWLGIKVNAARKQAEAVAAILKAGGSVNFDYQTIPAKPGTLGPFDIDKKATSSAPLWLCRLFGEDFFRTPVVVQLMLDKENPLKVAALQELAGITSIRKLRLDGMVEDEDLTKLEDLSNLEFLHFSSNSVSDAGLSHLNKLKKVKVIDVMLEQSFDPSTDSKRFPDIHLQEFKESMPNVFVQCIYSN